MANTHEHLEHAEHAEHHASDPFNQRVAVSMAIVAAILAAISMIGHRTHNKVLQLQGDSNRLLGDVNRVIGSANRISTEAASAEVDKSNLFAWYQSKRGRKDQLLNAARQLDYVTGPEFLPKDADPATRKTIADRAEAAKKDAADARKKAAEYDKPNKEHDNLPDLIERGRVAEKKAETLRAEAAKTREEATSLRKQAAEKRDEAEHVHHQADRFDIAHLSAEIGLVLCSIALLTKKKAFWFTGLAAAVVAIGLMASGYMIPHHPHESHESHETPTHSAPDEKGKPH